MKKERMHALPLLLTAAALLAGCSPRKKAGEEATATVSGVRVETVHLETFPEDKLTTLKEGDKP